MRFSTTFRLLLVVCVLALLIVLFDREKPEKVRTSLLDLKAADVSDIRIERGDFSVYCVKKDQSWFIAEPIQVRADDSKIDGIVGVLETLVRQETITRKEREIRNLTLKDYELNKPRVRLIVGEKHNGGKRKEELLIGQDSPLGGLLYVKLGTNDEIVATDRGIMAVIPEKMEVIRDRTILHGDVSKTRRIEIKRANSGFIQLAHAGNEWFIQQPIVARADIAKVQQMLEALYSVKALDFVWDATVETGEVVHAEEPVVNNPNTMAESYHLVPDQAVVAVTVWGNNDDIGREMFFGKDAEGKSGRIYARCKDIDSIYTVSKSILDTVSIGINDIRDRSLFFLPFENVNYVTLQKGDRKLALAKKKDKGWTIVEPVQWKADDRFVNELVGNISRLRVESFPDGTNNASMGFGAATCVIGLSDRLPETVVANTNKLEKPADKIDETPKDIVLKQGRLLIGPPCEGKETVLARFEEEPYLLEIAHASLAFLGKDPVDPLLYRDRTMLSIDPNTVNRLSILKGGSEQTIAKNEAGKWISMGQGTNQVDLKVVDDILFAIADMRAMATECQNPDNLVQYGLDRSGTTLTFGLTGEKGIQKTIVMGYRAKMDGIYALVQGLDVVFVISKGMMEMLTRDLIKPMPLLP